MVKCKKELNKINKLLTVVIPCYMCDKYLADCFDSISVNRNRNINFLFVDDGSTDNTNGLISKFCEDKEDCTLITNEQNMGCPESRIVGIKTTNSKYIFNFDADNILPKGLLLNILNYVESNDNKHHLCAVSEIRYFKEKKEDVCKVTHIRSFDDKPYDFNDVFKNFENPFSSGNYIYTRECWDNVGRHEPNSNRFESWYFSLKCVINGYTFNVCPDTFYYHRQGIDSLSVTTKKNDLDKKTMYKLLLNHLDILTSESVIKLNKSGYKKARKLVGSNSLKINDKVSNWIRDNEKHLS